MLSISDQKVLQKIAEQYELEFVLLFGSRAKGKVHAKSDTDIAIKRNAPMKLETELALRADLLQCFPAPIDLVFVERAGPLLLGELARNAELLYGDLAAFQRFRVYAMKRYIDFKPYFKLREQQVGRLIKELHAQ
jgi:predicted nucleotidyltransferase